MNKLNVLSTVFVLSILFSFYHIAGMFWMASIPQSESTTLNEEVLANIEIAKSKESLLARALEAYKHDKVKLIHELAELQDQQVNKDSSLPSDQELWNEIIAQKEMLEEKEKEITKLKMELDTLYKNGFNAMARELGTPRSANENQADSSNSFFTIIGLLVAVLAAIPAWIQLYRDRPMITS
jgi:hypothetical protein